MMVKVCVGLCTDHREKFIEECRARGIDHLIAQGKEALDALAKNLNDGDDVFDPVLMLLNMAIHTVLELSGPEPLKSNDDNPVCPVCVACAHGATESRWMTGAAQTALNIARERGAAPTLN